MKEMNNFTSTSDEPYDRHRYKIVSKHYCTMIVESWEEVKEWWWNNCHLPKFDAVVEVLDKPKTKKKSKGFS
jgi:hypothetical protein